MDSIILTFVWQIKIDIFFPLFLSDWWQCSKYSGNSELWSCQTKSCCSGAHITGNVLFRDFVNLFWLIIALNYCLVSIILVFLILFISLIFSVQWRSTFAICKEVQNHHTPRGGMNYSLYLFIYCTLIFGYFWWRNAKWLFNLLLCELCGLAFLFFSWVRIMIVLLIQKVGE